MSGTASLFAEPPAPTARVRPRVRADRPTGKFTANPEHAVVFWQRTDRAGNRVGPEAPTVAADRRHPAFRRRPRRRADNSWNGHWDFRLTPAGHAIWCEHLAKHRRPEAVLSCTPAGRKLLADARAVLGAEDLTQVAAVAVAHAARTFTPGNGSEFPHWAAIRIRKHVSETVKPRANGVHGGRRVSGVSFSACSNGDVDRPLDPEARPAAEAPDEMFSKAVDSLPGRQRAVLLSAVVGGEDTADIARRTGLTEPAVLDLIDAAKANLRRKYEAIKLAARTAARRLVEAVTPAPVESPATQPVRATPPAGGTGVADVFHAAVVAAGEDRPGAGERGGRGSWKRLLAGGRFRLPPARGRGHGRPHAGSGRGPGRRQPALARPGRGRPAGRRVGGVLGHAGAGRSQGGGRRPARSLLECLRGRGAAHGLARGRGPGPPARGGPGRPPGRLPLPPVRFVPRPDPRGSPPVPVAPPRPDLTARQADILAFIEGRCEAGRPPTLREIGAEFGIKSPNGVIGNLSALAKKGANRWDRKVARGIVPTGGRTELRLLARSLVATVEGGNTGYAAATRVGLSQLPEWQALRRAVGGES